MTKKLSILFTLLLLNLNIIYAQNYFNCATDNWGFEDGTLNGWTIVGSGTDVTVTTGGVDVYGGYPQVYPGGGNFSIKIEDDLTPGSAGVRRNINVPPLGTTYFSFHFAMSIFNYPHSSSEAAKFYVRLYDANGNLLSCPYYEAFYSTDQGAVGVSTFQTTPYRANYYNPNQNGDGNYYVTYTDWVDVMLDLTAYAGQTLTIEFFVEWCVYNADWAYAYVDVDCPINSTDTVSYKHIRAHETPEQLVCRLLLEKKNCTLHIYYTPHKYECKICCFYMYSRHGTSIT